MHKKGRYILKIEKDNTDYYNTKPKMYWLIKDNIVLETGKETQREILTKFTNIYNPIISFVEIKADARSNDRNK